jgi:TPR repeat protein
MSFRVARPLSVVLAISLAGGPGLSQPAVRLSPADQDKACKIARAAPVGMRAVQAELGQCLLLGIGGPRDPVAARDALSIAANAGNANAAIDLGRMHWNGDGTAKDNAAAATWWRSAHRANHPSAPFLLGQEAMVRLFDVPSPDKADRRLLDEAIDYFDAALKVEPDAANRAAAGKHRDMLRNLKTAFAADDRQRGMRR